ncbi:T9SS type A sorting domain-containing protein [Maribellus mangrovi]|uniref:T9SS type A sorting domain-containing protein n=1 Tax=Maribellus mangrovi TaxID=3133146 RepID=UPI0030ED1647
MKTIFTFKRVILIAIMLWALNGVREVQSQTKHVVNVSNDVFTPHELTIEAGDIVEWQNTQGWHNVNGNQHTYPNNPESFGNEPGSGWTYSFVFNTEGTYKYQCDPHVSLGMVGQIVVNSANGNTQHDLTISFTNMEPHNGQTLRLWVNDQSTGSTLFNTEVTVSPEFEIVATELEDGKSYNIDFYADHNSNGIYDPPPADHAWRLELNNVVSDTVLNFGHNVVFTDIFDATDVGAINEQQFSIYPNPATTSVNLFYPGFSRDVSIRIYDLAGKLRQVRSKTRNGRIELDVSELPRGMYFIQLQDGEDVQTRKLLKR